MITQLILPSRGLNLGGRESQVFLPIITIFLQPEGRSLNMTLVKPSLFFFNSKVWVVTNLRKFMSRCSRFGCQGRVPLFPIPHSFVTATTKEYSFISYINATERGAPQRLCDRAIKGRAEPEESTRIALLVPIGQLN